MKHLFLAGALTLLFGSLAYGQKMTVQQTLMKTVEEITAATTRGDVTVANRHMADNAVFTDPGGFVLTKAQTLGMFSSGDLKFESSKIRDMKVHVFGDTAVVTYFTTDKGTFKGREIGGEFCWTDVFAKIGGKWKLVSKQGTPVMKR